MLRNLNIVFELIVMQKKLIAVWQIGKDNLEYFFDLL
jgi:hypothetical protein